MEFNVNITVSISDAKGNVNEKHKTSLQHEVKEKICKMMKRGFFEGELHIPIGVGYEEQKTNYIGSWGVVYEDVQETGKWDRLYVLERLTALSDSSGISKVTILAHDKDNRVVLSQWRYDTYSEYRVYDITNDGLLDLVLESDNLPSCIIKYEERRV